MSTDIWFVVRLQLLVEALILCLAIPLLQIEAIICYHNTCHKDELDWKGDETVQIRFYKAVLSLIFY